MKIANLAWLFLFVFVPAHAAEFTNVKECAIGKRVSARGGAAGAVTEIRNGMCVVRHDDGSEKSYLHWMLSPADGARTSVAQGLQAGNYVCSAYGAGSFRIVIQGGGVYADRAGKRGTFSIRNGKEIVFASGSLQGQYSEQLAPRKFGLASVKGKRFSTVCNLK